MQDDTTIDDPSPLDEATRRKLSAQPTRDTKPELELRRVLHARGLRYRVDRAPLRTMPRRRADIVFGPSKVAVFVDGCFWHLCPTHGRIPHNNSSWWRAKLERNVERDRDTDRRLREGGWFPMRYWEHADLDRAADEIEETVLERHPDKPGTSDHKDGRQV